jgi:hypothetical protein
MTQAIIRIYDSENQGAKVTEHLKGLGYGDVYQFTGPGSKSGAGAAARDTLVTKMTNVQIWKGHAEIYADRLTKGKTLVLAYAPFGSAANAINVMDSYAPVDSGIVDPAHESDLEWDDAAPLSSILQIPVLTRTRFPAETISGLPSLTKGKAFLSSLLGLPLLVNGPEHKTSSMGLPLLSQSATPLSSAIGMRVLSQNATPLSALFRLPVLRNR